MLFGVPVRLESLPGKGFSHLTVVVKNTFVDMEEDGFKADPRRCKSEPPGHCHQSRPKLPKLFTDRETLSDDSNSTSCGSPRGSSVNDLVSDEGSCQGSECAHMNSLNPSASAWHPSLLVGTRESPLLAERCPYPPPSKLSAFLQMPGAPPNHYFSEIVMSPPPQHAPQHWFNPDAAAWIPSSFRVAPYLGRDNIVDDPPQESVLPR
mmetsp:Transcript_16771/g.27140  ORF Transcript_16771/g.27140 Transcript_16771/m.27140 type:complete len:207 (+) Transcript_16771:55-675(+)|eukprot:CAMPEP_0169181390 /NCGR_PEP_ID=MMETSP1015-20121227/68674_1 /TAXON_ID=342587 /ORGANISM="Karlodinium micrum, Strain CCMP2283" /LENGTH=206 /DNA_ID=CAMNT_0009256553 /DNA_START=55 /DNA_END=675 /DNA_ORIENTATION=-